MQVTTHSAHVMSDSMLRSRWPMLICDLLLVSSCVVFSIGVSLVRPLLHQTLQTSAALAPPSQLVLDLPYAFQVPLAASVLLLAANLCGWLLKPQHWRWAAASIFVIFSFVATIWLLGMTLPLVTIK